MNIFELNDSRMYKRKSDIRLQKTSNCCTLVMHAVNNNHTWDFDNSKILEIENNLTQSLVLESIHINDKKIQEEMSYLIATLLLMF